MYLLSKTKCCLKGRDHKLEWSRGSLGLEGITDGFTEEATEGLIKGPSNSGLLTQGTFCTKTAQESMCGAQ